MHRTVCRISALALIGFLTGCGGTGLQLSEPKVNLVVIGQSGSNLGIYATDSRGSSMRQLMSFNSDVPEVADLCRTDDGTIACRSWNGRTGANTGILIHPDSTISTFDLPLNTIGFAISPDGMSYCISAWDGAEWSLFAGPIGSTPTLMSTVALTLQTPLWVSHLGLVYDTSPGNSYVTSVIQSPNAQKPVVLSTQRLGGRGFSADGKYWVYSAIWSDGSNALTYGIVGKPGRLIRRFPYVSAGGHDIDSIALDVPTQHAFYTANVSGSVQNVLMDLNLQTREFHQINLPGIDKVFWVIEAAP